MGGGVGALIGNGGNMDVLNKGGGDGRSGRPGLGGANEIPSLPVRRRLSVRGG